MTPEVLTIAEVAAILKTSVRGIRAMIARGRIPVRYIGGRNVRFFRHEIDEWINTARGLTFDQMKKREGAACD